MASAMSVTWNSSKQSSHASSRERDRRQLDRILVGMRAHFHLLPECVNALVHVDHEFVEMDAAFSLDRACLEEQIHQHRLAAPDLAVKVEPLEQRLLFLATGEQPAERGRFPRQAIFDDPFFQPRQHLDDGDLRCISAPPCRGRHRRRIAL